MRLAADSRDAVGIANPRQQAERWMTREATMDRRNFFTGLAAMVLCPLCAPKGSAAERAHWSYEGVTGPDKWGDLDAASKVCTFGITYAERASAPSIISTVLPRP
jgi:hypothetical protein